MPATPRDVRRWLKQLEHRTVILFLGPLEDGHAAPDWTEYGIVIDRLNRRTIDPGDVWRRWSTASGIVALPSLQNADALSAMFGHEGSKKPFARCASWIDLTQVVLNMLEEIVRRAPFPKKPAKMVANLDHHLPDGFKGLAAAVAELPGVNRVRFWKYAGADMLVRSEPEPEAQEDGASVRIRIRVRDRAGLVADPACDHPDRVRELCSLIEDLLLEHCG